MDLGPILKIELQGIRQTMHHAFLDYQEGISKQVKAQLDRLLNEESFNYMIAHEVKDQFEKAVKKAIASYFEYGDGRRAIDEEIQKACERKKKVQKS